MKFLKKSNKAITLIVNKCTETFGAVINKYKQNWGDDVFDRPPVAGPEEFKEDESMDDEKA